MDSIQIYRAHVVELRPKICNKLFDIWRGELRRAGRRRACPESIEGSSALHFVISLQLRAKRFFKRKLVRTKFAQINLIPARNAFSQIIDFQVQLSVPYLFVGTRIAQVVQRVSNPA
jgi:hypothetical protein